MLRILKTEKHGHENREHGSAGHIKVVKSVAGEENKKEKLAELVNLVRANLETFIC